MQNGAMKDWLDSTFLAGENQSYIEEIYEDYLTDPNSVDESWREIFQQLPVSQGAEQSHLKPATTSDASQKNPLDIIPR